MNTQATEIIKLKTGCFLLKGSQGYLLVDTGVADKAGEIISGLKNHGASMHDICLIIVTHTHFDHVGSLAKVKKLSSAPVLIHEAEKQDLMQGFTPIPGSNMWLARQLIQLAARINVSKSAFNPVVPDIVISDNFDLSAFGINGQIVHTPGHTAGSISIVVDEEHCLVGDTLFNIFPGSIYPPFVNHPELLPQSWQKLLDCSCEFYHPAHGPTIHRQRLIKALAKLTGKLIPQPRQIVPT